MMRKASGATSWRAAAQLHAGHAGHPVVGDHHRHVLGGEERERGGAALRSQNSKLRGEDGLEGVEHARLVVDDEDRRDRLPCARSEIHAYGAVDAGSRIPRIS